MKWQVTIDDEVKDVELPKGSTSNDLVRHLDLHPDGLLVVTDEETMKPVPWSGIWACIQMDYWL